MLAHKISPRIKAILPAWLLDRTRSVSAAFLTPVFFSHQTGHFFSALKSRAINKRGEPIPWYTYPAIHFLECKNFSDRAILEFGGGQSTLWWGQRAAEVLTFEGSPRWHSHLKKHVSPNVRVVQTPADLAGVEAYIADALFDVIVIDGLDRLRASEIASNHIKPEGAIVLDESGRAWRSVKGRYAITDLFRSQGFSRIDFYGHTPVRMIPDCTSIFFKHDCFLFRSDDHPAQKFGIPDLLV